LATICIRYQGAISRSSVTRTAARIVLCIGHSEDCLLTDKTKYLKELEQYVEKRNNNV